jgi:hypothetical protein
MSYLDSFDDLFKGETKEPVPRSEVPARFERRTKKKSFSLQFPPCLIKNNQEHFYDMLQS